MENSWIKLTRGIQKHWVFDDPNYFKAWVTILLNVNFKDGKQLIEGDLIICKRGQSILSLQSWVKLFGKGWTIQKVRTFFKLLSKDNMVIQEGLRKTTRLSVCNYETYQGEQQTANTQVTHSQQTANTQLTTIEESKERKEGKDEGQTSFLQDEEKSQELINHETNPKRFPKDLQMVLDYCFIDRKAYTFDAWAFFETFTDNHWCYPKKDEPIKDWKAQARTWISKNFKPVNISHQELVSAYITTLRGVKDPELVSKTRIGLIHAMRKGSR